MLKADERTLDQLRVELARREAEYGISSDEFYDRWLSGLAGNIPDPAGWYALFEAAVLKGLPTLPEYVAAIRAVHDGPRRPATRLTPELIRELLAKYEAERGMSSAEFYERFMDGLEGDSGDAMEWTWLHELSTFPDHKHVGPDETPEAHLRPSLRQVFADVEAHVTG